jgi:hypothetical protein
MTPNTNERNLMDPKYRINGRTLSLSAAMRELMPHARISRIAVKCQLRSLGPHGVTAFETRNVADAGGRTRITVQRVG